MSAGYDPTTWQQQHPVGSRVLFAGTLGRGGDVVRVGKASRTRVRVKFLTGPAVGEWQTVHPDNLRPA